MLAAARLATVRAGRYTRQLAGGGYHLVVSVTWWWVSPGGEYPGGGGYHLVVSIPWWWVSPARNGYQSPSIIGISRSQVLVVGITPGGGYHPPWWWVSPARNGYHPPTTGITRPQWVSVALLVGITRSLAAH